VSHVKALVYHGPGRKAWEDVPDPAVKRPTDDPALNGDIGFARHMIVAGSYPSADPVILRSVFDGVRVSLSLNGGWGRMQQ
jgi:hypothetical protein